MLFILTQDKLYSSAMIRHSFNMDVKIWSTPTGLFPIGLDLYSAESRSIG